jgi:outer membrane protein assembly factor BamB
MSMTRAIALAIPLALFAGTAVPAADPEGGSWTQLARHLPGEGEAQAKRRSAPRATSVWTQWRGPNGSGIAADASVPLEWDAASNRNILWKTQIEGRGHSSPVVWGDRVFLTTAIEGEVIPGAKAPPHQLGGEEFKHPDALGADRRHTLKVIAIDRSTGAVAWSKVAYDGPMYDDRHQASSYASPTVAVDAERVYAYFGSPGLYVYDHAGAQLWTRDVGDIKTIGMGVGTSPVLWSGRVFIQADEDEGKESFLVALDAKDGKEAWRVARPIQASWTTPLVIEEKGGGALLVTAGNEWIIAYDPASGRELWKVEGLASNAIHVPLHADGMVYLTAGYPAKVLKALELQPDGKAPRVAWTYNKGIAYVPSNLLYGGRVYLTNDQGVLTCLDARTGALVYEGGRPPAQGHYMASLVAVGDKILMISRDGDGSWIKAGPVHEVLAQNSVDEPVYATPAIVGDHLYLRGERHLFAIGKSST